MAGIFGKNRLLQLNATHETKKRMAWNNAAAIPGSFDRRDCDGRIMKWSEYGRYSAFGWQIDHIIPVSIGGADAPHNLRARHWRGNCAAGGTLAAALSDVRR